MTRGRVPVAIALALAGCAAHSMDVPGDERLASLPRVPLQIALPVFAAPLDGMTFRVEARFDGALPADVDATRIAESCVANGEKWLGEAGWIPVRDSAAPADLVIEEHCMVHLSTHVRGNALEITHPEAETIGLVVLRDGAALVTVPRGPADALCESQGPTADRKRDCLARAERWAQARILQALIDSAPLREVARARAR